MKIRHLLLTDESTYADDLLSLDDAAVYLGVSRGRVSQLLQEGVLTRYPLNERCNLVAKRDLDRYAASARRHKNPRAERRTLTASTSAT